MAGILAELREEAKSLDRRLTLMEVCGTHTHSVAGAGLRRMMPDAVRLISGPGCPVCVTAQWEIDAFVALSRLEDVILTTFGSLLALFIVCATIFAPLLMTLIAPGLDDPLARAEAVRMTGIFTPRNGALSLTYPPHQAFTAGSA